jgi:hypothetical protein
MTPAGGMWWVIVATIFALAFGVGFAQNRKCKKCGFRKADCECER